MARDLRRQSNRLDVRGKVKIERKTFTAALIIVFARLLRHERRFWMGHYWKR